MFPCHSVPDTFLLPSQVTRLMKEYGLKGKDVRQKIHEGLHDYLPGERNEEAIREVIEEIIRESL